MGAGILDEAYIQALRPLQDGVPPRSLEEVSRIIERSVGMSMDELFISFDPVPVGAASIAQAHRATLADGREVIVKVQYPEVATLYQADFDNLEIVTRLLFPENISLIQGLRARHSAELDFRNEAANLREVRTNLQARGFEPALVRVPAVPDGRLCTEHVLAMEMLPGRSLAAAIEDEYKEMAEALGLGSAATLRAELMKRVMTHFEEGGGAQRFLHAAEAAAPVVRAYARLVRWRRGLAVRLQCLIGRIASLLGVGHLMPPVDTSSIAAAAAAANSHARADVGRAVRTLVRVHGVAMLLDGLYNADPHPGNVLIMDGGQLGLIDYGMCGRLGTEERQAISRVVLGLASGDEAAVVDEYTRAGYRACWMSSGEVHAAATVHRLATFHLDRIDLSPVRAKGPDAPPMPIMTVLHSTIEHAVPDWVEQARRLGGLLIGVGSQAGRPISLAHEWAPIAREVLGGDGRDGGAGGGGGAGATGARANARLRTHLTGLSL